MRASATAQPTRSERGSPIDDLRGAKKLLDATSAALGAVLGVMRHAAWYVTYRVEGGARDERD
jgi:hypothetical protein